LKPVLFTLSKPLIFFICLLGVKKGQEEKKAKIIIRLLEKKAFFFAPLIFLFSLKGAQLHLSPSSFFLLSKHSKEKKKKRSKKTENNFLLIVCASFDSPFEE
jgi:hypothetical protein